MSEVLSIAFSTADARTWAEAMVECLRKLPDGDPRRDAMRGRLNRAMRGNQLFSVTFRSGASVVIANEFARSLLIEARAWT